MVVATKNTVKLVVNVGDTMTVKYKGETRKIRVESIMPTYIKVFDLVKNGYRTFKLVDVEIVD